MAPIMSRAAFLTARSLEYLQTHPALTNFRESSGMLFTSPGEATPVLLFTVSSLYNEFLDAHFLRHDFSYVENICYLRTTQVEDVYI